MFNRLKMLLSLQGRMNRNTYLNLYFKLNFLVVFAIFAAIMAAKQDLRGLAFIFIFITALLFAASVPLAVRRLHDRSLSGWFVVVSILLVAVDIVTEGLIWLPLILTVTQLWLTIETLFRRGVKGPNRYGPNPLDL